MRKKRITVTVDPDIADYLDSVPNKSRVVSEAVRSYSTAELELQLQDAYRSDHEDASRLAAEWEPADAAVEE